MSSFIANPPFLIWMQMLIFWPMVFASCYLFVFPAVKLEMREMQCIPTARGCQEAHFHLRVKSTARKQELRNKTRMWSYCLLYTYPICIKSPSSSLSFSLSIQALLGYKVSVSKLVEMQQIHLRDLFELILKHIIRYSPITSPGTQCSSNMGDQHNGCWKLSEWSPLAFSPWQIWQVQFLGASFIISEQRWAGMKSPTCLAACGTFQKYLTYL